jgi:leader peptidase (prepilin peptidase) / N-methyltransferase
MDIQEWVISTLIGLSGCCVGSVLTILIYRLPRDKSLVVRSACPNCSESILFYDSIPILSWLLLRARCRHCKTPVSVRYPVIEFLTGAVFLGTFITYFKTDHMQATPDLLPGGWLIYLVHIVLLGMLITASAIDLEFWIIPLPICWFVTGVAIAGMSGAATILPVDKPLSSLIPLASPVTGALAVGGLLGLAVSMILVTLGKIKRSYEPDPNEEPAHVNALESGPFEDDGCFNHRKEACREIVFLGPVIILALAGYWLTQSVSSVNTGWDHLMAKPPIAAALGSLWGYCVGCGVIWGIRILGTLGFGKEAMGLGDVHLMGAVGAVIGAPLVAISVIVAALYGIAWGVLAILLKKGHQMPFGPFLSLATCTVMLFHDWFVGQITDYWASLSILSLG